MDKEYQLMLRRVMEKSAFNLIGAFKGTIAFGGPAITIEEKEKLSDQDIRYAIERGNELGRNYRQQCQNTGEAINETGLFVYLVAEMDKIFADCIERVVPPIKPKKNGLYF